MSWKEARNERTLGFVKSAAGASIGLGAGAFPLARRTGGGPVRTAPHRAAPALCASPVRGRLPGAAGTGARARGHVSYAARSDRRFDGNWPESTTGLAVKI